MKNQRKIGLFLILSIVYIPVFSQSWTKMQFSDKIKRLGYTFYVENRLNEQWDQKTFIIGGDLKTTGTVQLTGGVSYWSHYKVKQEVRPYQAIQYKGIRVMEEERIFSNGEYRWRTRVRIQDTECITKNISIKASNEIFFQQGYEHNRLIFSGLFKLDNFMTLETGYMFYRGKETFNALILTGIWKLR